MRLALLGVRGSTPAAGPDFVRYGGNTSCVAVLHDDGPPRLILDAGTGLTKLPTLFDGNPFNGSIILGHLHWDHTHGLPFCGSTNNPEAHTRVLIPAQADKPEELMSRAIAPPHFPVRAGELTGNWVFENIEVGIQEIEGLQVQAVEIPHPGGRMFGYRISDGKRTFSYVSDHSPIDFGPGPAGFGEYHEAIRTLGTGVDLLIHDAQYTAQEFPARARFGHSTFDYATGLAEACDVEKLLLFHHDPWRVDTQLDEIVEQLSAKPSGGRSIMAAVEGSQVGV